MFYYLVNVIRLLCYDKGYSSLPTFVDCEK